MFLLPKLMTKFQETKLSRAPRRQMKVNLNPSNPSQLIKLRLWPILFGEMVARSRQSPKPTRRSFKGKEAKGITIRKQTTQHDSQQNSEGTSQDNDKGSR